MKKHYYEPEILVIKTSVEEILTASNDEIFVDGEHLFS